MSFTSGYYLSENIVDINLLKGTTLCHVNCRSILNKLDEVNKLWGDFYNSNDPMDKWNMIVSHINEHLDVSCPLKLIKFAKEKEDWPNNEILELIYERWEVMKEFEKRKITCCLSRVSHYATEYRLG